MRCIQEHPPSDSKDAFIDAIDGCHDFVTTVTGKLHSHSHAMVISSKNAQTTNNIVAPASTGHCSPWLIHSVIGWKWK